MNGDGVPVTKDIYANARENDLATGTKVGVLTASYDIGNKKVTITYKMDKDTDLTLSETHLYVGADDVTTASPGQYAYQHEGLDNADEDSYVVLLGGTPPPAQVNIVAHAVVCKDK